MLTGREHFYDRFERAVSRLARCQTVFDLGTPYRFRKELEPFAESFGGQYVALGYHAEHRFGDRNVDIDGDIHALPFASGVADGVLCIEVLEHLPNPEAAVSEMYRVLRPGGHVLITTPFMVGYHGHANDYGDFYRYTDDGLRYLLRRFSVVDIWPKGGVLYRRLLTSPIPGSLRELILSNVLTMAVVNFFDRRLPTRSPSGWIAWAEK